MDGLIRFVREFIRWTFIGRWKIRSSEEIEARYQICKACPFYEPYAPNVDYGTCGKCGCNIHRTDKGLNKLAWVTTRCPDDPPRWT